MSYMVATDVGGTCTDTVVFTPGKPIVLGKALSTPPDFAEGVIESIKTATEQMGLSIDDLMRQTSLLIHGSTVVDNTLFTRDGSNTGLITTKGFEDTLHVTRGAYGRWGGLTEEHIKRPIRTDRAPALVPRDQVVGIAERIDSFGNVVEPIDEDEVEKAIRFLVDEKGVDAIATSFLWSFNNTTHEQAVRRIIEQVAPEIYISLSSEIAPFPGEYERTSTAVINAYAGDVTRAYLRHLKELVKELGYEGVLLVMQGYGGLLPSEEAGERAVGMLECGPAAGVIGSKILGDLMGDREIVAADMGGTTFKVGVIQEGRLEYAREPMVDRFHYVVPKIEIASIGAGGGSIIRIDEDTGIPKVGPESAGSSPGPVCYGFGGQEPTLTDVAALIGYMDPNAFLGGRMSLDLGAAAKAFEEKIAKPLGRSVEEAAIGIHSIAVAQMVDLIREITIERGIDTRDYVLHAFGGSCPLYCGMFGEELNVKRIVIPYTSSVNCAFGLISADVIHEYAVNKVISYPCSSGEINEIYEPMLEQARAALTAEGFDRGRQIFNWSIDLRYRRQVHVVNTSVSGATPLDDSSLEKVVEDFEHLYELKYGKGSAYRDAGVEMTMFRLTARGLIEKPEILVSELADTNSAKALTGTRRIYAGNRVGMQDANIYNSQKLKPGNVVAGPAVIQTPITTIVVYDKQSAAVDKFRNIIIEFNRD